MPVWDKAAFDQFYSSGAERFGHPNTRPQIRLHYHWWPIMQWQASDYAPRLFATLGMNAGDSVVLVGAGFNGTGAGLAALGIDVIGTDISPYVQAEKGNTEEAEVRAAIIAAGLDPDVDKIVGPDGLANLDPLDLYLEGGRASPKARGKGVVIEEDMRNRPSRNTIKNALASTPRFIISEEVLNSITDTEALKVCDRAAKFSSETGAAIVHMLSPLQANAEQASELNWKTYAVWRAFLDANGFQTQRILPTVTAHDQGMTLGAHPSTGLPRTGTVWAYSGTF